MKEEEGRRISGPRWKERPEGDYLRCLLTSLVISNIETCFLLLKIASASRRVDHPPVLGVLELVPLDVGPELLRHFGPWYGLGADDLAPGGR